MPPHLGLGRHVQANGREHAIALGDGSFVGFPTPCGEGRGCGNPLCTMSCIRRVSRRELLHWAGSSFEAEGGELQPAPGAWGERSGVDHTIGLREAQNAGLRAVHLLGRDGSMLFGDEPAALARWCLGGSALGPGGSAPAELVGWSAGSGPLSARAAAAADLRWLKGAAGALPADDEEIDGETDVETGRCPISNATPAGRPHVVEGVTYTPRLLLRWLENGVGLHPSSGKIIGNPGAAVKDLQAAVEAEVEAAERVRHNKLEARLKKGLELKRARLATLPRQSGGGDGRAKPRTVVGVDVKVIFTPPCIFILENH
jgi:hypothetical protein